MRIIGIDPGLQSTGWGVIASDGAQFKGVSHGIIRTNTRMSDPERLILIFEGLQNVIANHQPEAAIVEEIFVKDNPLQRFPQQWLLRVDGLLSLIHI